MIEPVHAGRREVRNFGLLFAGIAALAGVFYLWKANPRWWIAAGLSAVFLLSGLFAVPVLRPVYKAWMRFAAILAWINTRVLLTLFFLLVITPVGVIMRLFGRDILEKRIDRSRASYWIKREGKRPDRSQYEHLF